MRVMPPKGGARSGGGLPVLSHAFSHAWLFIILCIVIRSKNSDQETSKFLLYLLMIAPKDPFADEGARAVAPETEKSASGAPSSDSPLPNSKKVYVSGTVHPDIRVPFREIALAPTKAMSGEMEV